MQLYILFELWSHRTQAWCSHLTDPVSRAYRHKQSLSHTPQGSQPVIRTHESPPRLACFFFFPHPAVCFSGKVSTKQGEGAYHPVAQTTNWHPVSYPGVHAEAGPVPAEHLPGPVPAAAPQEGPHAAQVHRGRDVRAPSANNATLIRVAKNRITVWPETAAQKQKKKYFCFTSAPTLHRSCWPCSDKDVTINPNSAHPHNGDELVTSVFYCIHSDKTTKCGIKGLKGLRNNSSCETYEGRKVAAGFQGTGRSAHPEEATLKSKWRALCRAALRAGYTARQGTVVQTSVFLYTKTPVSPFLCSAV